MAVLPSLEANCLKLACVSSSPVTYIKYIGPYFAMQLREACKGDTLQHVVDHFSHISGTANVARELIICSRNQRAGERMHLPPRNGVQPPSAQESSRCVPQCNRRVYLALIHLLLAAAARPDVFGPQAEQLPKRSLEKLLEGVPSVSASSCQQ